MTYSPGQEILMSKLVCTRCTVYVYMYCIIVVWCVQGVLCVYLLFVHIIHCANLKAVLSRTCVVCCAKYVTSFVRENV